MKLKKTYLLPHKNTNWAFLDGLLCGVVVVHLARSFYNDWREIKQIDLEIAQARLEEKNSEKN